jgi:hypothetical protein
MLGVVMAINIWDAVESTPHFYGWRLALHYTANIFTVFAYYLCFIRVIIYLAQHSRFPTFRPASPVLPALFSSALFQVAGLKFSQLPI